MGGFLSFLQSTWVIFLVVGVFLGIGIAGYYVDKNTDILNIEKKKKELRERSMDVELLKSQIEDKNLSLGGAMGIVPKNKDNVNNQPVNNNSVNNSVNNNTVNGGEDLSVPLDLSSH